MSSLTNAAHEIERRLPYTRRRGTARRSGRASSDMKSWKSSSAVVQRWPSSTGSATWIRPASSLAGSAGLGDLVARSSWPRAYFVDDHQIPVRWAVFLGLRLGKVGRRATPIRSMSSMVTRYGTARLARARTAERQAELLEHFVLPHCSTRLPGATISTRLASSAFTDEQAGHDGLCRRQGKSAST